MEKILVIEDNDLLREDVCEILELEGYEVFWAENGQVGVEKIMELTPDLIISDINMPVMNGIEVLKHIKANKRVSTTPFIFLTALTTMEELRLGMDLGADDYLTKPFDLNQLLMTVRTRLNKKNEIVAKEEKKYDQLKNSVGLPITSVIDDPLRNIERLAELITGQLGELSDKDIGEITRLIANDASKLRKEVNKVLYFYRIEALKNNSESLAELSEQITNNVKDIISVEALNEVEKSGRKNDLTLHIEDADLQIPQEFLEHIFKELLSNACQFSTKGSGIKVTGRKLEKGYKFTIQDNGIGFNQEKGLDDIGPFTRLSQQQGKSDGLGLGLYNAKTLVELFGGQIELDSEPGYGTSIGITFGLVS